jgi:hypothetical protein
MNRRIVALMWVFRLSHAKIMGARSWLCAAVTRLASPASDIERRAPLRPLWVRAR